MNKNIARYVAISALSATVLSCNVTNVPTTDAAGLLNEVGMAGITVSLDTYVAQAVKEEKTVTKKSVSSAKTTEDTTKVEEEKEEQQEEIKLNLVYDRLGIAKVDNYLNIRKEPGEDGEIIGKLPKNAGCHIYKIEDGWAKIISGGVKGWVSADYLVIDEEAEAYAKKVATKVATVNTETLKVRALPSVDSKVYDLVPMDEELEVKKENLDEQYFETFLSKQDEDSLAIASMENVNKEAMMEDLDNWVCITIDSETAFVSKEFVDISFKLERAVPIDEVETNESTGVSSVRASMVSYAMQFLGNRYVYGGTSLTNGTDCSGFTMRIYEHFGYSIPRTSSAQASYFTGINSSEAKPGDLFFYGSGGRVSHVAMYIGNGQVIHASNARTGIKISNAFYRSPIKVGRIINN